MSERIFRTDSRGETTAGGESAAEPEYDFAKNWAGDRLPPEVRFNPYLSGGGDSFLDTLIFVVALPLLVVLVSFLDRIGWGVTSLFLVSEEVRENLRDSAAGFMTPLITFIAGIFLFAILHDWLKSRTRRKRWGRNALAVIGTGSIVFITIVGPASWLATFILGSR